MGDPGLRITRLYAEACPDDVRMRRRWSAADSRIAIAAEAALGGRASGLSGLPARAAARAAARLAAQHATGGLTADGILAVLLDTSTRAGLDPPLQAAARLAARIAGHLAETGITVAGAPADGAAPRPASPAPAARPGPPPPDPRPAPRPAGRVPAAAAVILDTVFWRPTAPLERLHQAARRPGRLRRLRAALPVLIYVCIISGGVSAAAAMVFSRLPWSWQGWLALTLLGAVVPAGRPSRATRPRREPR